MNESGNLYFLPFLFLFILARSLSICQENHMQKGFPLFLHKRLVIRRPMMDHRGLIGLFLAKNVSYAIKQTAIKDHVKEKYKILELIIDETMLDKVGYSCLMRL